MSRMKSFSGSVFSLPVLAASVGAGHPILIDPQNLIFNVVGAQIIGRVSDYSVIKWRKRRNGVWYPEDRLRAALVPFGVVTPVAVLSFGLENQFIDGSIGLGLCLFGLFMAGVGVSYSSASIAV